MVSKARVLTVRKGIAMVEEMDRASGSMAKKNERRLGELEKTVCYAKEWLRLSCNSCHSKAGLGATFCVLVNKRIQQNAKCMHH